MQLDLWVDTLDWNAVDTIAIYDGFVENGNGTSFNQPQLGPDGKIYWSCTTRAPYLHVIHNPDEKGIACNVEQHAIRLKGRHRGSMPYFPNYRLGALEGSPCDTIVDILNLGEELETNPQMVKVYPNPTTGKVTVSFDNMIKESYQFILHNAVGQKVFITQLNKGQKAQEVIFPKLPSGIYYYRISWNGMTNITGKLVLE